MEASQAQIQGQIGTLQEKIQEETEKQAKWKKENERRRHNYVPLIFELLQQLAKKNMLDDMFKDAIKVKKEKLAAKKKKEEEEKNAGKKDADGDTKMK